MLVTIILVLLVLLLESDMLGCLGRRRERQFKVERYDGGDAFTFWSGQKNCSYFKGYWRGSNNDRGSCNSKLRCCCENPTTFNTLSGYCEGLYNSQSDGE